MSIGYRRRHLGSPQIAGSGPLSPSGEGGRLLELLDNRSIASTSGWWLEKRPPRMFWRLQARLPRSKRYELCAEPGRAVRRAVAFGADARIGSRIALKGGPALNVFVPVLDIHEIVAGEWSRWSPSAPHAICSMRTGPSPCRLSIGPRSRHGRTPGESTAGSVFTQTGPVAVVAIAGPPLSALATGVFELANSAPSWKPSLSRPRRASLQVVSSR
jgi:hypothetical protein